MSKRKNKKGPQILTVALLVTYPVLCGQAATSFALSPQQLQGESRTPLQAQLQNQTKSYQYLGPQSAYQSPAFFAKYSQTEEEYQNELKIATQKLSSAKATLASATQKLKVATANKASTKTTLDKAQSAKDSAQTALDAANSAVLAAQAALDAAQEALDESDANLTQQEQILSTAQAALNTAQDNLTTATSNLTQAQTARTTAQQNYQTSQTAEANAYQAYQAAQNTTNAKLTILQLAQQNYNNSSVPNPNYVAPSYQIQPTSYQIPDANFMTGGPWIGDGSGSQGQPEVHPGHLHFSYIPTEVYQDILLYPRQIANYNFTVAIWNQDQNSVNRGPIADTYSLRIYFYDADNNLLKQDSITSSAVHSWQDITLQGNTNTTTEVAKVRIGVYGIDNGFWAGTYGPAANNVRLTLGWITGTTQAATTTGTLPVQINEGGMSTFTAPNGGIFVSSNLRYEAIDDPTCGANVTPQGFGSNTITLAADNGVWGDPCGGWYKHLVGTLTYSAAQPQFIKDASLLPAIAAAQLEYDNALTAQQQALTSYQSAQGQSSSASSTSLTSQQDLEEAQAAVTSAQSAKDEAQSSRDVAKTDFDSASASSSTKKAAVASATVNLAAATSNEASLTTQLENIDSTIETASTKHEEAIEDVEQAQDDVTSAQEDVDAAQDELDSIPEYVAPEPEEPKAPEIPKGDPRELSKEEVTELVAKAEAVLESAEQGSPAYEQALEALAVAAQADDPQVPTELLAIPLLGETAAAVLEAFNDLGNIGADMAPQVREDAEKTVLASIIATGAAVQAVQAAAGAAASAASAAASSASSSTTRRSN